MSVRRLAAEQPASFAFTPENQAGRRRQIAKYPGRPPGSAVIPLLWRAQEQTVAGCRKPAIETVGRMLGMPNDPRARGRDLLHDVQSRAGRAALRPALRHDALQCCAAPRTSRRSARAGSATRATSSPDGNFSWLEVECLGACCNAPMVQINDDYYEDLTPESFDKLLDDLAAGRPVKTGPQSGRHTSEPKAA